MNHLRHLMSAVAGALMGATVEAAEPPELPSLSCTVVSQAYSMSLRLQVRFENQGTTAVELPPGPYLVMYADSAATDPLEVTARLDRVQRTPVVVLPGTSRVELFSVGSEFVSAHACEQTQPRAAGIYFYRFNRRPQSRCLLGQFDAVSLFAKSNCPGQESSVRSEPK
jgi:hypothetical protein